MKVLYGRMRKRYKKQTRNCFTLYVSKTAIGDVFNVDGIIGELILLTVWLVFGLHLLYLA